MGYMHIDNLYKNKTILLFKQCYALEKIHGTSAHISFTIGLTTDQKADYTYKISFFSGGEPHCNFIRLFDEDKLKEKFINIFKETAHCGKITIYGEAYGGKQQGMSATYGNSLKFIAFDISIEDLYERKNMWLRVPEAEEICKQLGLEFVHYELTDTNLISLDKIRMNNSVQAIRNGITEGRKREGIVLRPLIELKDNRGERIIAKYKNDEFSETKTKREVKEEDLKVLIETQAIVNEWVTEARLNNILSKLPSYNKIEDTGTIIKAMVEDVLREASGEIVENKHLKKAISIATAKMFKEKITTVKELENM